MRRRLRPRRRCRTLQRHNPDFAAPDEQGPRQAGLVVCSANDDSDVAIDSGQRIPSFAPERTARHLRARPRLPTFEFGAAYPHRHTLDGRLVDAARPTPRYRSLFPYVKHELLTAVSVRW